jgi:hypothetical protein
VIDALLPLIFALPTAAKPRKRSSVSSLQWGMADKIYQSVVHQGRRSAGRDHSDSCEWPQAACTWFP